MRAPVEDVNLLEVVVELPNVRLGVPCGTVNENQKPLRKVNVLAPSVIVRRYLAGNPT